MPQSRNAGKKIGSKTLPFDIKGLGKLKDFDDVDRVIRSMMDILEEINRRLWLVQGETEVVSGGFLAQVDEILDGGGHYTCSIQQVVTGRWNTDSGVLQDKPNTPTVTVLNITEVNVNKNILLVGDYIMGSKFVDSAGVQRYIGLESFGRQTIGECP